MVIPPIQLLWTRDLITMDAGAGSQGEVGAAGRGRHPALAGNFSYSITMDAVIPPIQSLVPPIQLLWTQALAAKGKLDPLVEAV